MTTDLADHIRSALDEMQRTALAAAGHVGHERWLVSEIPYEGIFVTSPANELIGDVTPTTRHIAHNDPAAVLRRVATERRLLERHAPQSDVCAWCPVMPWPCPDITDLVDRLGINTEDETA